MMKIYEAIARESDRISVMKPTKFWSHQVIPLSGMILATVVLAFGQGTPPLPSQAPGGVVPPVSRPQGPPPTPLDPCAPNRLTVPEQIQNGVSLSDILQQENRAVSCKVDPAVVEVSASGFGAMPGQEYDTPASAAPDPQMDRASLFRPMDTSSRTAM